MKTTDNKSSTAEKVHLALCVADLDQSRRFYTNLFSAMPAREANDQIDWILSSPPVHFSIYVSDNYEKGLEHMGFVFPKETLDGEKIRLAADEIGNIYDPDGNKIELYTLKNQA